MSNLRSNFLGFFLALGAITTSSAFAYTPLNTTSTTSFGPSTISYVGQNVPCHMAITLYISPSGYMSITDVIFEQQPGDSSFCTGIVANGLPWRVSPATLVSGTGSTGTYVATAINISYTIPKLHITCTGSISLLINDMSGSFSFTGTLYNGSIACGTSGTEFDTLMRAL
jgi:hypothetical protein